jgi:hypothetical protein
LVKKARLLLRVLGGKLDVSVVLHNPEGGNPRETEGDALAFSAAATGSPLQSPQCLLAPHLPHIRHLMVAGASTPKVDYLFTTSSTPSPCCFLL